MKRCWPRSGGSLSSRCLVSLVTPLIVGFGKACEVAKKEMKNDAKHVEKLYNKILTTIKEKIQKDYEI